MSITATTEPTCTFTDSEAVISFSVALHTDCSPKNSTITTERVQQGTSITKQVNADASLDPVARKLGAQLLHNGFTDAVNVLDKDLVFTAEPHHHEAIRQLVTLGHITATTVNERIADEPIYKGIATTGPLESS